MVLCEWSIDLVYDTSMLHALPLVSLACVIDIECCQSCLQYLVTEVRKKQAIFSPEFLILVDETLVECLRVRGREMPQCNNHQ